MGSWTRRVESIERALTHHQERGTVTDWKHIPARGSGHGHRWEILLRDVHEPYRVLSTAEVEVLCWALAGAELATYRRLAEHGVPLRSALARIDHENAGTDEMADVLSLLDSEGTQLCDLIGIGNPPKEVTP